MVYMHKLHLRVPPSVLHFSAIQCISGHLKVYTLCVVYIQRGGEGGSRESG